MYRWIDDDHMAVDDTVFRLIGSGEVDGAGESRRRRVAYPLTSLLETRLIT